MVDYKDGGWKIGDKITYYNNKGELHRDDGPAAIYPNGTEFWLKNGSLHRDDGPAVIRADGSKEYFLNGEEVQPF